MPKLYQLTARAQMHGEVREPGYVFTLADGELGPHRTVLASDHGTNFAGNQGEVHDVPLYVEVVEPKTEKSAG